MSIQRRAYKVPPNLTIKERKQQIFNKPIKLDSPCRLEGINFIINYKKRPLGSILLAAYIYDLNGERNSFILPYYINTEPNINNDIFNPTLFSKGNNNQMVLNYDPDIIIHEINFDLQSIYDAEFEVTVVMHW